jgi:hypothetical protein
LNAGATSSNAITKLATPTIDGSEYSVTVFTRTTLPLLLSLQLTTAIFGLEKSGGRIAELHQRIYRAPLLADQGMRDPISRAEDRSMIAFGPR